MWQKKHLKLLGFPPQRWVPSTSCLSLWCSRALCVRLVPQHVDERMVKVLPLQSCDWNWRCICIKLSEVANTFWNVRQFIGWLTVTGCIAPFSLYYNIDIIFISIWFSLLCSTPRISSAVAPTAMTRCDETQNMSKELTRAPKHSAKRCRVSSCRQWKNALLFAAVKPGTHTMDSRFQNLQISWIIFPSSCRGLATRSIENSSLLLRSDSW